MLLATCLLIFVSLVQCSGEYADYCEKKFCSKKGVTHVACGPLKWGQKCPLNAELVSMKPYYKYILQYHNLKRNELAGGNFKNLSSAARMASMIWNNELALIAIYNVAKCESGRDGCRQSQKFPNVGQNTGVFSYNGPLKRNRMSDIIENMLNTWWAESNSLDGKFIYRYPRKSQSIQQVGVMINEMNVAMGCAASRFTEMNMNTVLFTCNYASKNTWGQPIYIPGQPISLCKTGGNKIYKNLCSSAEVY